MSGTGTKLARADALRIAERFIAAIEDACDRIELAGSLRRGEEVVGDIELVCISRPKPNLIGEADGNQVDDAIERLISRSLSYVKNGAKYKQLALDVTAGVVKIDIFITDHDCWPVIFAIRTGPAEYSHRIVTPRSRGGRLMDGYHVKDGRLRADGGPEALPEAIDIADERTFLDVYCGGWLEPHERPKLTGCETTTGPVIENPASRHGGRDERDI